MNIKLKGNYVLTTDKTNNFVLQKEYYSEKHKEYRTKGETYYGSDIALALKSYINKYTLEYSEANSIKELQNEIEDLKNYIEMLF